VTARARVGIWLGPLLCGLALVAPAPAGLSADGWRTAAVGLLMAVWWVTEAVPIAATALLPLALLPLLGVAGIDAAAAPYANPIIFLFLGGFVLAAALERSGLHRRVALAVVRATGARPARAVGGVMAATALISMWVSNTATALMMLPIAVSVLRGLEAEQSDGDLGVAMMLAVAYGANIGGLGTLIGTPPNALLAGFADEAYGIRIGFVEWMLVGVPLVLVSLPLVWWLLTRVLHPLPRGDAAGAAAVLDRLRPEAGMTRAEWVAGAITAATAAAWVTRPMLERWVAGLSDAGIAIAGALLLFIVPAGPQGRRAISWDDVERLPWDVLILFGGGLSLAAAIDRTGLAAWLGGTLEGVGAWPVVLLVLAVTTMIILLTELTSNTATAAAFLPIVAALAVGIGREPLLLAVSAALAASCAFMLPVATPPNAVVYGSGRVTVAQMARAGVWVNLLFVVLIAVAVFTVGRAL